MRPGLSFAFFTQSLHFIPQYLCRGPIPLDIDLHKYHYAPEIELLQDEAKSAREFGSAAAEEWLKGLASRGRIVQKFATQMEEWESNGGLEWVRSSLFRVDSGNSVGENAPLALSKWPDGPPATRSSQNTSMLAMPLPITLPTMPLQSYGVAPGLEAPVELPQKPSDASSMGSQTSNRRQKAAPSSREVARIRAYKKEDIIARCRTLRPPISRDMLERLDAYENALRIPMPLNDNSWEALKGLLIQQRRQIELEDEVKNSARTVPTPGQFIAPQRSDEYLLAHVDVPVKEKLCQMAEEFIKQKYGYGGWITYPTAPQFAAEVLIHVRQMFMAEKARIEHIQARTGFLSLSTPQDETLKYEHMKWVFDQTIKPRTEQIRKDLFLCAVCPNNGNGKYFAFESMIQHFAFKHDPNFTTEAPRAFWKCEWPENPPFDAHPERACTPTPSITHTPTLSHMPLSAMSPGSAAQMPSMSGRRTPDTMSLLSNNTTSFSIAGYPGRTHNPAPGAPGPAMYELQRDTLTSEICRSWKILLNTPLMPISLQVHLALNFAVGNFSKRYKNDPPLSLLKDCICNKAELRELRDSERLRCAECVVDGGDGAQMQWSLQDLLIHFEKMHLETNHTGSKIEWKNDMILLPEPAAIRSLLADNSMPTMLLDLLKEAEINAVIKMAPMAATRTTFFPENEVFGPGKPTQDRVWAQMTVEPPNTNLRFEDRHNRSRRGPQSTAATFGDLNSSRDTWSTSSHTVKAEDASSVGSVRHVFPDRERHITYSAAHARFDRPLPSIETVPSPVDRRLDAPRGETMARSDTIRSHRSRGETIPGSTAEDFLSTIDAQLDVEMADSGSNGVRSTRVSQPISRTNSVRDASTRASRRPSLDAADSEDLRRVSAGNAFHLRQQSPPLHVRRDDHLVHPSVAMESSNYVMERQPSRIIEFDQQGNPVSTTGHVYQEVSPPRPAVHRQYDDAFGRPVEPSSPTYVRTVMSSGREPSNVEYTDRRYPQPIYGPIEYASASTYRPERIVDSATGQIYVAERPPVRQLIEIDERFGRPPNLYDEMGRPIRLEYRQVDANTYRPDDLRYERYPTDYQKRRYQGR